MSAYEAESFDTPPTGGDLSLEELGGLGHTLLIALPFALLWFDGSHAQQAKPALGWLSEHYGAMIAAWAVYVAVSTHYIGALRAAYSTDGGALLILSTVSSSVLMPAAFFFYGTPLHWSGMPFLVLGMAIAFAISGILFHTNVLYWGPRRRNPDEGMTVAGAQC